MANYLPLLLVSVTTNAIPDDTSVSTQPRGQVDYLSHEWREEDVWRSWRNMTRQKNEIANGARLENASWRTWWKQRNKLKTISPETLNWLKDSDVTWLYGPLHTALDWSPPPKPKPDPTTVDKEKTVQDRLGLSTDSQGYNIPGKKPILKHRSISDLLTSALPNLNQTDDASDDLGTIDEDDEEDEAELIRPHLMHTKSDTNISRYRNNPFRKDSPPRIIAPVLTSPYEDIGAYPAVLSPPVMGERSGSSDSARDTTGGSSQDLNEKGPGGKKKHISFNTFVEQCIAIDSPQNGKANGRRKPATPRMYDDGSDDGYDPDSEVGSYDDGLDEPSLFSEGHAGSDTEDDDEDDDDDILEMRTASSRSRSSSSSRSPGLYAHAHSQRLRPNARPMLVRANSSDKEHMTIAPIAPTMLKTTGVGNHAGLPHGTHATAHVNLVYVPSLGGSYGASRRSSSSAGVGVGIGLGVGLGAAAVAGSAEDVYRHREARFSVGAGSGSRSGSHSHSGSGSRSPSDCASPVPAAEALPPPIPYARSPAAAAAVLDEVEQDAQQEETFDYFGGAGMEKEVRIDSEFGAGLVRYAQGGAESVQSGRSSGFAEGHAPEVVVNDEDGPSEEFRERERSRSRSRSRSSSRSHSRSKSRTPSPAEVTRIVDTPSSSYPVATSTSTSTVLSASPSISTSAPPSSSVPVPRSSSSSHLFTDTVLLSPPEHAPHRGRSAASRSSGGGEGVRGRSATRSASSFSDRDRSGSRGTSSPLGSVSPTASSAVIGPGAGPGIGAHFVYPQGQQQQQPLQVTVVGRGRASRLGGRGASGSMSPPSGASPVIAIARSGSLDASAEGLWREEMEQRQSLGLGLGIGQGQGQGQSQAGPSSAPVLSASMSSVSTISSSGSSTEHEMSAPASAASARKRASGKIPLAVPSQPAIMEEEEQARSRQPTPANSPVRELKLRPARLPAPAAAPSTSAASTTSATATAVPAVSSPTHGQSKRASQVGGRPTSPAVAREEQAQAGTLVGRAAEIVSSARGLWGSFWHGGSSSSNSSNSSSAGA